MNRIAQWFAAACFTALAGYGFPAAGQAPQDVIVRPPRPATPSEVAPAVGAARSASVDSSEGQIARWNQPICLAVGGFFDNSQNKHFKTLIEEKLTALGQQVLRGGCTTNAAIIFTYDQAGAIERLAKDHPATFFGSHAPSSLVHFVSDLQQHPRPVIWWRVATTQPDYGPPKDAPNLAVPGFSYPAFTHVAPSRLTLSTRADIERVAAFVNLSATHDISDDQLAAYLAIGSLIMVNEDAPLNGVKSILTLFGSGDVEAPADLTVWDKAYVRALYTTNANSSAAHQRSGIGESVRETVTRR